jgi:WD40 repeat protein/DNA-binding SARP family transcriptional activator
MDFRLLGPIAVSDREGPLSVGGPKPRVLLAHLVLELNQFVSTDRLIAAVWEDNPPATARNSLQSYASRLRKELGSERLEGRTGGYILQGDEDEVDVLRFERLVERARATTVDDPATAVRAYQEALAQWRGPALEDLAGHPSLRAEIARLEELRLAAIEELIEVELSLGRHAEVVAELERLTARHRLRERFWGQFMVAQYRSGRQGEALGTFQRARDLLADELGIDPSPELQRVHQQILRQDLALEVVGTPLRGYRLLEQIGEGEFGVVHRGFHAQMGREVAIKAIHPHLANDPRFIRRFETEAQLVARLEHPHLVPLYDYWREPDGAYLVMRYLRGGSLRDALEDGPLELADVAAVIEHIGPALAVAHDRGVVHRDVKPENVLLDEAGNAYLSDFGIAKELTDVDGGRRPAPSHLVYYLSPEEARGGPVTVRSDIYSLGLVVFEMLAGRHAYADVPPDRLQEAQVNEPVPSLRSVRPDLPSVVDDVVGRATAKDPATRFEGSLALVQALRVALAAGSSPPVAQGVAVRNPYKGLRAFAEADAGDFFGRERLVERLTTRLGELGPGGRFLAVVGPSGSGKSSLVRAGLVPALRAGAVPGSETWFVVEMLPGTDPFAEFRAALRRVAARPLPANLADQLPEQPEALGRAASWVLPDDGVELLLVVDQFEELFALVDNEQRRTAFLDALTTALADPDGHVRVVVTLRADFYDRPLAHAGIAELFRAGTEVVTPLGPDELERAVVAPAERVGVAVEPGLLAEVVADVADEPGALPLVQYALTELFDRREAATLELATYRELQGISGALARRAEEVHGALDTDARAATRQLFLRLVTLGEGVGDTRRRAAHRELLELLDEPQAMTAAVDAFGEARLLSFDRDPETREPTVEVAHEALLREWRRLRGWIEAARDQLRAERRLAAATREWVDADRDVSYLAAGTRLAEFEALEHEGEVALTPDERTFLTASVDERDRLTAQEEARQAHELELERRSLRRLRALVAVLTAAALVATGLTFVALRQTDRLAEQVRITTARELAAAAIASLDVDPDRAILLALEAVDATFEADGMVTREAEEALHHAVSSSRLVYTLRQGRTVAVSSDGTWFATGRGDGTVTVSELDSGRELHTLSGHEDAVSGIAVSPDDAVIATTSFDSTTRVWDAADGRELRVLEAPDGAGWAAGPNFSPDGRLLGSTGGDGVVRIWDVETGTQDRVLRGYPEFGFTTAFSPDGERIAVSGGDRSVVVFDLNTGEIDLTITGHDFHIPRFVWSPDGTRIATSSNDGTTRIWDASSGEEIEALPRQRSPMSGIAFSPDGSRLATGTWGATVHVWDVDAREELLMLAGHTAEVTGVAFTPDGDRLLTAGMDETTRLWDVSPTGARSWVTVQSPALRFSGVAFSPDGTRFAVPRQDAGVTIHDVTTGGTLAELEGHDATIVRVAYSPDGRLLAGVAGSSATRRDANHEVPVWDLATGRLHRTLAGHGSEVVAVSFSPDGGRLVTGGYDTTVRVWDVSTGELEGTFEMGGEWVPAVTFSPDGTSIVISDEAGRLTVLNAKTLDPVRTWEAHGDLVFGLVFAPDGRLVSASRDGTAKIWDTRSGAKLSSFLAGDVPLGQAALSPDGSRVGVAAEDGSVRVWDAETGRGLLTIHGHDLMVYGVAFSPDGRLLATSSPDGTTALHLLPVHELVELARERVTRDLTEEECRQFLRLERCPEA